MRTSICLLGIIVANSSGDTLPDKVAGFAAVVIMLSIVMDVVDFVLNIYYKSKK